MNIVLCSKGPLWTRADVPISLTPEPDTTFHAQSFDANAAKNPMAQAKSGSKEYFESDFAPKMNQSCYIPQGSKRIEYKISTLKNKMYSKDILVSHKKLRKSKKKSTQLIELAEKSKENFNRFYETINRHTVFP